MRLIALVLLVLCAIPIWGKNVQGFPDAKDSVVVQVQAQQFGWNVLMPGKDGAFQKQDMALVNTENPFGLVKEDPAGKDDVRTLNDLTVPVNKPVLIHLSSKDVIHSFKVIAMRVTQDAIPGLRIPVHFTPTAVGKYQINCAQLCGNGHAAMTQGFLNVVTQEEFEKWAAKNVVAAGGGGGFE